MNSTYIIIAITAIISLAGFANEYLVERLILWPKKMHNPVEYYRLITSGFVHADWMHLLFNMYSLYAFGITVEYVIHYLGKPSEMFYTLYLSGIIISSLPSFAKNRNNAYYRSLGASGGVAAVVFFSIYYFPWGGIRIMPIPFDIPAIIFGVLYLAFEAYMARKGAGNVNHDAHFWGSVYGLVFALVLDPSHGKAFINEISHPRF